MENGLWDASLLCDLELVMGLTKLCFVISQLPGVVCVACHRWSMSSARLQLVPLVAGEALMRPVLAAPWLCLGHPLGVCFFI